jgi:hypothetical protein
VNDTGSEVPESDNDLISRAQQDAQSWANLLYGSGGSLEISKCFTYMTFHDWKSGRPTLRKPDDIPRTVTLRDCSSGEAIPLPIIDPDVGTRTLGVRIAPSGIWKTEFNFRLQQAKDFAKLIAASQFSRDMADIALRRIIMPAVEYPLGTVSFTQKQCEQIQRPILRASLQKMGYPSNFPRAVVFGQKESGGVGIRAMWTERCIQHIMIAAGHLRKPGRLGDMILCNLRWQQRLAGVSFHIWEFPKIKLDSILEKGWTTTGVREALAATNCKIHFTTQDTEKELLLPPLARTGDSYLMDDMIGQFQGTLLYKINACRLWLQITRLSDIISADGCNFRIGVLTGTLTITREHQSGSRWPRQEYPPKKWWSMWSKAVRQIYARDGDSKTTIRAPLGLWNATASHPALAWDHYYDVEQGKLYERRVQGWRTYQVLTRSRRQPMCLPASMMQTNIEPPVTAVPAEVRKTTVWWRILHKIRQQIGDETVATDSVENFSLGEFLATQSQQVRRLMHSWVYSQTEDDDNKASRFAVALETPERYKRSK